MRSIDTKILSNEEYSGLPFSFQDLVQEHVNREDKLWYKDEPIPLPAYKKRPTPSLTVGLYNFLRAFLP